jgi:hypothetical protein
MDLAIVAAEAIFIGKNVNGLLTHLYAIFDLSGDL